MTKYIPPSFDEARVIEGLRKAMGFGEPTRTEDKVTFYFNARSVSSSTDEDGVPFDPATRVVVDDTGVVKDCAVEYQDRAPKGETFGVVVPSRIIITMLDPDWQDVEGFAYVKAGGDTYWRSSVEPPIALGSLDVWQIICTAEGES